ncbi:MAG: BON domain-containing protein [Pseudomonadota bacterium]
MKRIKGPVLLLILALFQVTPALARSDDLIQREIEMQIAESTALRSTRIEVHVEERLVVLSGEVRLYEQRLIAERISWTTLGVFEVDNEIRVVPKLVLSDAAIEQKIREIVKADERFRATGLVVRVNNGKVFLSGSFLDFHDPSILKHKVAEIEGVVGIEVHAAFLAERGSP